jgi:hypothetical protein
MKRHLLSLLLAACSGPVFAAKPALCTPILTPPNPDLIARAASRLAAAHEQPGTERLALADADANFAREILLQSGSATAGIDGGPVPQDLMRDALAIWSQAQPSAALARNLRSQATEFANAHQCAFAQSVLQAALTIADRTAGADSPDALAVVEDALKVAMALGDATTVSTLTPRRLASLRPRTAPLNKAALDVNEDLIEFHYQQNDNELAEQYAQRSLALLPHDQLAAANARRLQFDLASIYYAELRFADAEALRTSLGKSAPSQGPFERERDALIERVRAGDLEGALARGQALLAEYQRAWDKDKAARDAAEQRFEQLRKTPDAAKAAVEKAGRELSDLRYRTGAAALHTGQLQNYVGEILLALGRLDEGAAACEAALAAFGTTRSATWSDVNAAKSDLAVLARMRGDTARALALQEEVLKALLPLLGPEHPDVLAAQAELAALRKQ